MKWERVAAVSSSRMCGLKVSVLDSGFHENDNLNDSSFAFLLRKVIRPLPG